MRPEESLHEAVPAFPLLSAAELEERSLQRRAVEAAIWGMPAVNYDRMLQALLELGAENQIVCWSRLLTWRNQTLTPNPESIYLMPFFDTHAAGPMVLEIPAAEGDQSITGNIDDAWQAALEDAGPSGADRGRGGKYLILPPGFSGEVPAGFIPLRSDTYGGFALLRCAPKDGSEAEVARSLEYSRQVRFYPLSQAAHPKTTFLDATEILFDATIPYDLRFFESLHRIVQREPWLERDRAMIDTLKSIGIEKGKPFRPDADTRAILEEAIQEAHAWLEIRYRALLSAPFNPGRHWAVPAASEVIEGQSTFFARSGSYPISSRAVSYSVGFVGIKHLGSGQFYLMAISDQSGRTLDGGRFYRLHVPPDVPVKQYWSATVYDRSTHTLLRNQERSSRSSHTPELAQNEDGSVDLYFGPDAPGGAESNWIPTVPGRPFEVLFRFYGPRPPLLEKTWALPDIERPN